MKFVIGSIHSGTVDGHYFHSLVHLLTTQLLGPEGEPVESPLPIDDVIMVRSGPALQLGRGVLCNAFMEDTTADVLLMLDTDMTFTPAMIHQMWDCFQRLPESNGPNAKILGGLAFIASAPKINRPDLIVPNIWLDAPDRTNRYIQANSYPEDQLVKVGATGAACLMIHREVFEKIAADMGTNGRWFYHEHLEDGDELGEDISFCRRAAKAGYPVYVHTGLVFGHTKPVVLDDDDYRRARSTFDHRHGEGASDDKPDRGSELDSPTGEPDRGTSLAGPGAFPGPRPGFQPVGA